MKLACRPQLWRLAMLDSLIRSRQFPNATSAAQHLEVNRRTVKRDLEFLRERLHAPLEFSRQNNGYYYTEPDYALPLVRMTEGELIAIFLATQLLQQYGNTAFEQDIRAAFAKLADLLPGEVSLDLSSLGRSLSSRPFAVAREDVRVFRTLAAGLRRQQSVRMTYWTASRDDMTERTIDPYHVALIGESWYVIGYCHLREQVLTFATARVRSARLTGDIFSRPDDFRIEAYLDGGFRACRGHGHYRVVLRFSREVAGRVEEKVWHKSQRMEPASDGGLIVRLELSDLREVLSWALSWGADCEVLEPREFREMVADELERVRRQYGPRDTASIGGPRA
jgi:predicted DNA-binding transcriptional regulator YafY